MIQAIVFDLDDTLYPEHEFVASGFRAVSNHIAAERDTEVFFDLAWTRFEAGERGNIFDSVLAEMGLPADRDSVKELLSVYRNHEPSLWLFEDAAWALDRFSGERLALITDGYLTTQQHKVAALGIEPRFERIVFSDALGRDRWKPHPAPYEAVMRSLQIPGEELVYIADNPRKDFVTAKRLGWHTIQILRENGEYRGVEVDTSHEAHCRLETLRDLERVLSPLISR